MSTRLPIPAFAGTMFGMVVKCFATIWFARNIAFAVGKGECQDGNCGEVSPAAGRVLLQHKQSVETVKEDLGVGVLEDMLSEHDVVFTTQRCLNTQKSSFGKPNARSFSFMVFVQLRQISQQHTATIT